MSSNNNNFHNKQGDYHNKQGEYAPRIISQYYHENMRCFETIQKCRAVDAIKKGDQPTHELLNDLSNYIRLGRPTNKEVNEWRLAVREMWLRPNYDEQRVVRALEGTGNEALALVLTGRILAQVLGIDDKVNIEFGKDYVNVYLNTGKNNYKPTHKPNKTHSDSDKYKGGNDQNNKNKTKNNQPTPAEVKDFVDKIKNLEPNTPAETTTPPAETSAAAPAETSAVAPAEQPAAQTPSFQPSITLGELMSIVNKDK